MNVGRGSFRTYFTLENLLLGGWLKDSVRTGERKGDVIQGSSSRPDTTISSIEIGCTSM